MKFHSMPDASLYKISLHHCQQHSGYVEPSIREKLSTQKVKQYLKKHPICD
jgi:hypothetical protein